MAISGSSGNEVVNNYGTVTGNINLGPGANSFQNLFGALLVSGRTLYVGSIIGELRLEF